MRPSSYYGNIRKWGITMAKLNLKAMDVEELLTLRHQVDARLLEERKKLEERFARLPHGDESRSRRTRRRGKSLMGRKIAAKYRSRKDPSLTWAGRGLAPRWMREEMKAGKLKKDAFLIK
jgi:DNA-binding protein H-NS